ncbi:MAG: transporter [Nitrospirae bacterium]|nr:transporter [Nitrospirota bacterium]
MSRLEFGVESARFSSQTTRYTLMTELTYGLLDHLNFEVEAPYFLVTGPGGTQGVVGDVTLRPKVLFLKGREANPLSLAGEVVLKFPSCDESGAAGTANPTVNAACTGETDLGFIGIATKEFLPVTVHLNIGYTFVGNPPGQTLDNVISYALAFEYGTVLPAIVLVGELAGETDRNPRVGDNPLTLLVGVMYRMNRRVNLDGSLTAGLTSPSPDYGASLGVSYSF